MFTNANLFSLILNTGLEPWFSIASIDFLRPLQGIWDSDDHSMALSTPRNRIAQILWRVYIYPILLQSLCDGSKPRPFVLLMYVTLCSTGLVLVSLYIYNYIYIYQYLNMHAFYFRWANPDTHVQLPRSAVRPSPRARAVPVVPRNRWQVRGQPSLERRRRSLRLAIGCIAGGWYWWMVKNGFVNNAGVVWVNGWKLFRTWVETNKNGFIGGLC